MTSLSPHMERFIEDLVRKGSSNNKKPEQHKSNDGFKSSEAEMSNNRPETKCEAFYSPATENKTHVVRIRRSGGIVVQDCDVYIGRACTMGGWNLAESIWHNPFTIKDYGASCINKFEEYLLSRPDLMARLPELKGKRLGCWCDVDKGKVCHGLILKKYVDAL